jgi:dihydrofolate synthase / folylpolyglutamate synthase
MIFQMLKEFEKKVWVYTSPHNIDIRERFETQEWLISQDDFARLAVQIIEYGHGLSYFEKCVLLAFLYFREQECEYAVIEVGMGGRLDATNILMPILSIITSISYDHMEFLGDTLEEIAHEKWGIIKPWVPVILYGENPTLEEIATERDVRVMFPKKRKIYTNLLWEHQISNWRIAYEAGVFLEIPEGIIEPALLHVGHHGRLEHILPNLLIDGAHNEDGMRKLQIYLSSLEWKWCDRVYCTNLKKWKPIDIITDIFCDVQGWIVVESSHQMVADASTISSGLSKIGKTSRICKPSDIILLAKKSPRKLFVVFGSLYMIGEFLSDSSYEYYPAPIIPLASL